MRKLASVQEILAIDPIDNADAIEVATIMGWQVVVRKDSMKVGDKVVFFEIDSLIPIKPWSKFLDKKDQNTPQRLKTIKLRGQISQGLVVPISEISELSPDTEMETDVTEILGVGKWEPQQTGNGNMPPRGTFPSIYLDKTDEERIQSNKKYLAMIDDSPVMVTQKLDGCSATFILTPDTDEFMVTSRNMNLKDSDNIFWNMARKYDIEAKLRNVKDLTGASYGIQGEIVGPSIQKNRMGLMENTLFIFNVWDLTTRTKLPPRGTLITVQCLGLLHVPIIDMQKVIKGVSVRELVEYAATSRKYPNGHPQEGVVVRMHRTNEAPEISFKVINNEYLLKTGE